MATLLFPTTTAALATSSFTTTTNRLMDFSRGSGSTTQTDNTVASLVTAANPQGTGTIAPVLRAAGITLAAAGSIEADATIGASLFWISPKINGVTISGTITANLRASESAIQANYGVGCKLYQIRANAVIAAFAQGSNTTEIPTSDGANSIALTPTSTTFFSGDQIGLLIFFCSAGGTSNSGRTAALTYAGTSGGAAGDTSLSFTEAITAYPGFVREFNPVPFQPRPSRPG